MAPPTRSDTLYLLEEETIRVIRSSLPVHYTYSDDETFLDVESDILLDIEWVSSKRAGDARTEEKSRGNITSEDESRCHDCRRASLSRSRAVPKDDEIIFGGSCCGENDLFSAESSPRRNAIRYDVSLEIAPMDFHCFRHVPRATFERRYSIDKVQQSFI